jgi:hypothetical protein
MALQLATEFHGLAVPEGYWRAERFVFTSKTSCRAYMTLYASAAAASAVPRRELDGTVVDFEYDFTSADSLHAQAYTAAKAMPEFAGATDV